VTDSACKACSGSWPRKDHFIADLGLTTAYLHDDQYFPGWTLLVFKRHAMELFQLAAAERCQMIEEVSRVAETLAQIFEAIKMNYELLGNQLPHIHWHIIPRLATDPAPLEPVWLVRHEPVRLASPDLQRQIQRIQNKLQS
jgi:diadenosine tetraphosphate (Ap4A) HIT family hydrolase